MAGFFSKLINKITRREEIDWDELEETLIGGDIGMTMTMEIVDRLQGMGRKLKAEDVAQVCREEILAILGDAPQPPHPPGDRPLVILMLGVNGTGKTTSTAKLAHFFQGRGNSVMLAAADTFRAAAVEQLEVWAQRANVPIVKGPDKADPSSVCFSAYEQASAAGIDILICDTAGRLHTRHNLMEELKKIQRTLARKDPSAPHEAFLVVDATTGSNALNQAKEFHKAMGGLTGVIATKLDGSGKAGSVVSIRRELGVPTRFIGTGEAIGDFALFDPDTFVREIL
ncbi:MAG: signal recognition particle-docking protein FtsY [Verrucomicrobiales bacterium]